ncbi:MAG: hypothetical protein ABH845_02090, partial [Candidatus Omnitrophota bacterium]
PYLYLDRRHIPKLFFLIFGLLLVFSYVGIKTVIGSSHKIAWPFFFLGAGFLLLEVQNISKAALFFGTTWTVNTFIISAVLVMILLANAVVIWKPATSLGPYFIALFISLIANWALPPTLFLNLPPLAKGSLSVAFMSLPIFFAGILFSSLFSQTKDRSGAIASNLMGAMVGGMTECFSFLIGIKALLIVAVLFYLCALISNGGIHPFSITKLE